MCFNVEDNKSIELPMAKVPRIQFPQFTKDERRIVARLPGIRHSDSEVSFESYHGGSSIVVWTLGRNDAHMIYLFKDFDTSLAFSIVPGAARSDLVEIVTSDGDVIERNLNIEWNSGEELQLWGSRKMLLADGKSSGMVTDNGGSFVLAMCSRIK
jgi:hypothetical protein